MGTPIYQLDKSDTIADSDYILTVSGTYAKLIRKDTFKQLMGSGLSESNIIKLSKIIIDGAGNRFLKNDGNYSVIAWDDIDDVPFNQDNINMLKLFSTNESGELLYNGEKLAFQKEQ